MKKHVVQKTAPKTWRVPENLPDIPKFRCVVADPAWTRNMTSRDGRYGSALDKYDLMALQRIKDLPVADLMADDAHAYIWCMNGNIDEGLEVMKAWGFRYITKIDWIKPKMGVGNYWRNASEVCLFGVRGKLPPKCKTQINWFIDYPTEHSVKPRMFTSMVEKVSPGPYLELFCRRRPASSEKWYCWGNQCEGGSDVYIPGYPVPRYSFDPDFYDPDSDPDYAPESDHTEEEG